MIFLIYWKNRERAQLLAFRRHLKLIRQFENSDFIDKKSVEILCSVKWDPSNAVNLVSLLVSLKLSPSSRLCISGKLLDCMPDFPASLLFKVYLFALQLCNKPIAMFNRLNESFVRERTSESKKVLLTNLVLDLKNDENFIHALLRELKNLTSASVMLRPLHFGILCSLAGCPKLQNSLLELLSKAIVNDFQYDMAAHKSGFVRTFDCEFMDPVSGIHCALEEFISSQHLSALEGLLALSFCLIQLSARMTGGCPFAQKHMKAQSRLKQVTVRRTKSGPGTSSKAVIAAKLSRTAFDVLVRVFKDCDSQRRVILSSLIELIWSNVSRPLAVSMTELLSELVVVAPLDVLRHSQLLHPCVEAIGSFSDQLSMSLIHALIPLIRLHGVKSVSLMVPESDPITTHEVPSSLDHHSPIPDLFYQLRNLLIRQLKTLSGYAAIEKRRAAIKGFVLLLKHLTVNPNDLKNISQGSTSSSQLLMMSQSQTIPQQASNSVLFSQIMASQVLKAANCDVSYRFKGPADELVILNSGENDSILCSQILSQMQRICFSTFFLQGVQSHLDDPQCLIRSDVYWGLTEVASKNPVLVEPVVALFLRMLSAVLPKTLFQRASKSLVERLCGADDGAVREEMIESGGSPFRVSHLVQMDDSGEIRYAEHPDVLIWCLQLIVTLPKFSSMANYQETINETNQNFTQFCVPAAYTSSKSSRLFTKALHLLIILSHFVAHLTPQELEVSAPINPELSSSPVGKRNKAQFSLLLAIYDACIEFQMKRLFNDQDSILEKLFKRREHIRSILFASKKKGASPASNSTSISASAEPTCEEETSGSVASMLPMSLTGNMIIVGSNLKGASQMFALQSAINSFIQTTKTYGDQVFREEKPSESFAGIIRHSLQTVVARISAFSSVPCVYRDQMVSELANLLLLAIPAYATALNETATQPDVDKCYSQLRTVALETVCLAIHMAHDSLGNNRLHKICLRLHDVVQNPRFGRETTLDVSSEEIDQLGTQITPAISIGSFVALLKKWISQLLKSCTGAEFVLCCEEVNLLLPTLVSLCRVRASYGYSDQHMARGNEETSILLNTSMNNCVNPLANLDRVLMWLLRVMSSPLADDSPNNAIVNQAKSQIVAQCFKLSSLLNCAPITHESKKVSLNHAQLLHIVASDFLTLLGDVEDSSEIVEAGASLRTKSKETVVRHFLLIDQHCVALVLPTLLEAISNSMEVASQALNQLVFAATRQPPETALQDVDEEREQLIQDCQQKMSILCSEQLIPLSEAVDQLLQSALKAPSHTVDVLLDIVSRLFDLLTRFIKKCLSSGKNMLQYSVSDMRPIKLILPANMEQLVRLFGQQVSPHAHRFIYYLQLCESAQLEEASNKSKKSNTKAGLGISKDVTLVPKLVFSIEDLEKNVRNLGRQLPKTGESNYGNLMHVIKNLKLGLARDFRINLAKLHEAVTADDLHKPDLEDTDTRESTAVSERTEASYVESAEEMLINDEQAEDEESADDEEVQVEVDRDMILDTEDQENENILLETIEEVTEPSKSIDSRQESLSLFPKRRRTLVPTSRQATPTNSSSLSRGFVSPLISSHAPSQSLPPAKSSKRSLR
ncbi:hypothetical protein Ciccas_009643 [Cichlidogyrus casuarinus]|uniref:FANCI solenoid 4 domain-containing protein n=1 Tax=Cichlidogyrus casuarinus TaxID=1844966 RepID=A0ABD2PY79_9PLAT